MQINAVYISDHGTSSGIWPRFFLQMVDLGEWSIGKSAFENRAGIYFDSVMPLITDFSDTHDEIIKMISDYKSGILSGKYLKFDAKGQYTHTKTPENKIEVKVKEFFIKGKILLVNFVKSGIVDDPTFLLKNFYFADSTKFENQKEIYLAEPNHRYLPLINLTEKAQEEFLREFSKIRGDIEHNHFSLPDFPITIEENNGRVDEPDFCDNDLSTTISSFYNQLLEWIEKLVAYFLGINGELNKKILQLYVRRDYDYPQMIYKYVFSINGTIVMDTGSDKCNYE